MKLAQTIAWYNLHPDHYAGQANKFPPLAQLNDFTRLLSPSAKVLDAGCGTGRDASLFTQKGFRVTGIDLSKELLKIAKKNNPNVEFAEGSFLNLPFPDRSFEGVWAHASLVHLETFADTQKAISEFARVTKPGGALHIMVKARVDANKFVTLTDSRTNDLRFFQLYTRAEIEKLTEKTGYKTIKLYQFTDKNSNKKYKTPVDWMVYLGMLSLE